jgi:hypothetical protein
MKTTTKLKLLTLVLTTCLKLSYSQEAWLIGPMVHINFGGEKTHVSYAVECSVWDAQHPFYGADAGIEFERNRVRIYSELQAGLLLTGVSAGPVLEINTLKNTAHLGFQSSVWANYFVGVDYRKRWIDHTTYNCVGFYTKVPLSLGNDTQSDFLDTNGNHHHNEEHYSHHHHHHHH